MPGKTYKDRITVTLKPSIARKATRVAKSLDISRSKLFEDALEAYLTEAELQAKLLGDNRVMGAFAKAMSAPGVMSAMASAMGEEITESQQTMLRDLLKGLGEIGGTS